MKFLVDMGIFPKTVERFCRVGIAHLTIKLLYAINLEEIITISTYVNFNQSIQEHEL